MPRIETTVRDGWRVCASPRFRDGLYYSDDQIERWCPGRVPEPVTVAVEESQFTFGELTGSFSQGPGEPNPYAVEKSSFAVKPLDGPAECVHCHGPAAFTVERPRSYTHISGQDPDELVRRDERGLSVSEQNMPAEVVANNALRERELAAQEQANALKARELALLERQALAPGPAVNGDADAEEVVEPEAPPRRARPRS
jgi:hypothetical protein